MKIQKNDVVQINGNKWTGCLGIVEKVKSNYILIGIPIPEKGTAYIYCDPIEVDYVGKAVLIPKE